MKIFLLGPFKLETSGVEIPLNKWKSKKALTLFKYLVSKRGHKVPKDTLIETLWPDIEEIDEDLVKRLHSTIYLLRKALNEDCKHDASHISYADGLYWYEDCTSCWMDVDEFDTLYQRGLMLYDENPSQALSLFKTAIELYRGDYLPEEVYQDWTTATREQYRDMYMDVTLRASELLCEHTHEYAEATRLCRAALRLDPYREELHQMTMISLIKAGKHAEAGLQYRQCTKMLAEEFGLDPSPETRALFDEMKNSSREPIDGLRNGSASDISGPFICDKKTFDSILAVETRRQKRNGEPLTLMSISLPQQSCAKEHVRSTVLDVLMMSLRQGDVVAVQDSSTIVAQLPKTGDRECAVVKRRIDRSLAEVKLSKVAITCSVQVVKEETSTIKNTKKTPAR